MSSWWTTRRRDEAGAVAVLVAILVPVLFGVAAFAVDVARWYVEGERIQKAADAASLAGVIYMPQDFAAAKKIALLVAARNGYAVGGDISIDVKPGPRPSQLQVTISNVITNNFAFLIGQPTTLVARTSISDYTGPAPMGSPCWFFGNQPDFIPQLTPTNCLNPNFWATIEGPATDKQQGDEFMTRKCDLPGTSGCDAGGKNTEYDKNGYFWALHVEDPTKVSSIQLQIYDAAYVNGGLYCESLPNTSSYRPTTNYDVVDPTVRYAVGSVNPPVTPPNCTGDFPPGGQATDSPATAPTTTFVLRAPTDSQNPLDAPVISTCQRQFFGWSDASSLPTVLNKNAGAASSITDARHYQPLLAESFHRWAILCNVPQGPQGRYIKGDYYLQVRTNVKYGAPTSSWSTATDDLTERGYGNNGFALRAVVGGDPSQVAIGSIGHMPIYANDPSHPMATFNLIRVAPGAAGKTIKFTFFDVGDATGTGTASVRVLAPDPDGTSRDFQSGKIVPLCQGISWTGAVEPLNGCIKTGIGPPTWQGKFYTINVPIPADYNCGFSTLSGCWWRVQYGFTAGTSLHDVTTWSATIEGDPVRLVK